MLKRRERSNGRPHRLQCPSKSPSRPDEIVARRYDASLSNLSRAVGLCDETYLYDNTANLELEARFKHEELAYCNPTAAKLRWLTQTLEALGYFEVEF